VLGNLVDPKYAVFNRSLPNSYLQVIFKGTYWTRFWLQLSKEEEKNFFEEKLSTLGGLGVGSVLQKRMEFQWPVGMLAGQGNLQRVVV